MTRKLSTCKKGDFLQRKEKEEQGSFLKQIPLEATLSWLSRVYAMMLKCALFANPKHFFSCSVGFALSFHRVSKSLKKSHYSHLLGHFAFYRIFQFFKTRKWDFLYDFQPHWQAFQYAKAPTWLLSFAVLATEVRGAEMIFLRHQSIWLSGKWLSSAFAASEEWKCH